MQQVAIQGIVKRYRDVVALAGVDLDVAAGESLVVVGPSGSGKSTLLRVVAGLVASDAGVVCFDGRPQGDLPPHRRGVAMVFQHFALYPHLSAEENITLGLRHGLGMSRRGARERAREVAGALGIGDLLGRRPGELSGGQQQRVALARALARRAGVVLLDEPLSGLDARLKQDLRVEIAALLRQFGATSIHVTHDQMDAMAMGDRIAVMRAGAVEQVGTPEEVYRRPATSFVASFLGTPAMNVLDGRVNDGRLHCAWLSAPVATPSADGPVTVGIRPEDLVLDGDGDLELPGTVVSAELAGSRWVVHVRAGDAVLRAVATTAERPARDTPCVARVHAGALHLFDAASGRRMAEPRASGRVAESAG